MSEYLSGNWLKGYSMDRNKRNYDEIAKSIKGLDAEREKNRVKDVGEIEEDKSRLFKIDSRIKDLQIRELGERERLLKEHRERKKHLDYSNVGGKRTRRGIKRRNRYGRGPMKRPITDVVSNVDEKSVVSFDFATPQSLTEAFERAIKDIKNMNEENLLNARLVNKNRALFLLLTIMGLYAVFQPSVIPALTGTALDTAKDLYHSEISGLSRSEYETKMNLFIQGISQARFVFQNSDPMTSSEILEYLKRSPIVRPLVETIVSSYRLILNVGSESFNTYQALSSLLSGGIEEQFNMKNIKEIVGGGLWTFVILTVINISSPVIGVVRSIASKFNSQSTRKLRDTQKYFGTDPDEGLNTLLLMNIDGKERTITLKEIRETIDSDKSPIAISYIDWFLAKLFEHEEAWTLDETDEKTVATSVHTLHTNLTNETARSLESVSTIGYGYDTDLIAKFVNMNIGGTIQNALKLTTVSFTTLYETLLKTTGYVDKKEEDILYSQTSEISDITMESKAELRFSDLEVETMTIDAVVNSVKNTTLLSDRDKRSVINQITSEGELTGKTMFGGRRRRKTRKHKKHIKKSKRKSHRKRR